MRCATTSGRAIGLFLHDNFARPGKRSGAWMSSYRVQETLDGEVLPVVVNNNNFSQRASRRCSASTTRARCFTNSATGCTGCCRACATRRNRALRCGAILSSSRRRSSSTGWSAGKSAPLRKAFSTGEPLTEALLDRLLAARNFNQGFATVEYTSCALLDLDLHARPDPGDSISRRSRRSFSAKSACRPRSGCATARRISSICSPAAAMPPDTTPICGPRCSTPTVLPRSRRRDPFDPELAARLKAIYSAGDTADPMTLYRAFRGRDPAIGALLEQRGLTG